MSDEFVGSGTPAEATPTATPAAATPAVNAQPATPANPAASPTSSPEDRSNWVPPYRIRETRESALREAQTQFSQREQEYQARLNQIQSQLHALVGVHPQNQNPEVDAVRSQFAKLYPNLAKLEDQADKVFGVIDKAGDLESQNGHYWQSYGRQTMDRLYSRAAESLGAPLTDEGKRSLHSSFVGFIQSSPELTDRYANDPSIVEDFWKAFTSSFIDPVRRTASATVTGRVPGNIPQDTPSGAPRATPTPGAKDLDERAQNAWAQYQQTAKT